MCGSECQLNMFVVCGFLCVCVCVCVCVCAFQAVHVEIIHFNSNGAFTIYCVCIHMCVRVCAHPCVSSRPTCAILIQGTVVPRQGVLEGVAEVPDDPGHDGVVVQSNHEGHQHRRNTWTQRPALHSTFTNAPEHGGGMGRSGPE